MVEQRHLHGLLCGQLADVGVAQGGDPAEAGVLPQVFDLGVGEHAAVADQHEALQAETVAQGLDLVGHGGGVGGVAGIGLHGERAALAVGEHAVDDDRPAALAVAAVAEPHQGAGTAFVVAAGDVVKHLGVDAEVALGEPLLDAALALQQPVHGLVEGILVGVLQAQFGGQGGGVPEAGGGELGGGLQQALGDHGEDTVAMGRGTAVEQSGEAQLAASLEDEFDMAVRAGADDGEGLVGADERFVLEQLAEGGDLSGGPGREIGEGALADLGAFAPAFAEEDGRGRVAVGDDLDVHGNIIVLSDLQCQ